MARRRARDRRRLTADYAVNLLARLDRLRRVYSDSVPLPLLPSEVRRLQVLLADVPDHDEPFVLNLTPEVLGLLTTIVARAEAYLADASSGEEH
jgi:hypothetical protein